MIYIKNYKHYAKERYDETAIGLLLKSCFNVMSDTVFGINRVREDNHFYKIDSNKLRHKITDFFSLIDLFFTTTDSMNEDKALLLQHLDQMTPSQFKTFFAILMANYSIIEMKEPSDESC